MFPLTLPEFDVKVRNQEIFCLIRKKWVALLPEEWVRQHFINLLITHLDYPKGRIKLEQSITYFKNAKRADITVMDDQGKAFLIVECKSYKVELSQNVVNQLAEYNKEQHAQFLAITNGLKHFIWKKDDTTYRSIESFPMYK